MRDTVKLLLEKVMKGESASDYILIGRRSQQLFNTNAFKIEEQYIHLTEQYRRAINKSNSISDIAKLGIICICEMTGDVTFLNNNIDKIERIEKELGDKCEMDRCKRIC